MSNKEFEKFKKTGSIEDYLKYIKSKRQALEIAQENEISEVKKRDCSKNNKISR